jgi:hypothetical protein
MDSAGLDVDTEFCRGGGGRNRPDADRYASGREPEQGGQDDCCAGRVLLMFSPERREEDPGRVAPRTFRKHGSTSGEAERKKALDCGHYNAVFREVQQKGNAQGYKTVPRPCP